MKLRSVKPSSLRKYPDESQQRHIWPLNVAAKWKQEA